MGYLDGFHGTYKAAMAKVQTQGSARKGKALKGGAPGRKGLAPGPGAPLGSTRDPRLLTGGSKS
jgi:hypothetical protein